MRKIVSPASYETRHSPPFSDVASEVSRFSTAVAHSSTHAMHLSCVCLCSVCTWCVHYNHQNLLPFGVFLFSVCEQVEKFGTPQPEFADMRSGCTLTTTYAHNFFFWVKSCTGCNSLLFLWRTESIVVIILETVVFLKRYRYTAVAPTSISPKYVNGRFGNHIEQGYKTRAP